MDKELLIEVGKRIKEARSHLKITQEEFAAGLGMSKAHLSAVEIGKIKPGFNFLYKANQVFNINPLFIFNGVKPMLLDSPLWEKTTIEILEALFKKDKKEFLLFIKTLNESSMVYHSVLEFFYLYVLGHDDITDVKDIIPEDNRRSIRNNIHGF